MLNNLMSAQCLVAGSRTPPLELQASVHEYVSSMCPTELSEDSEFFIKLVEDMILFARDLSRATSSTDYAFAVVTFAKLRTSKSLTSLFLDKWNLIMGSSLEPDLQSGEANSFQHLRYLLDNYSAMKELPIFKKLHKFLVYCLGTTIFEKLGVPFDVARFLKIEKAAAKKEFFLGPDFVHCMFDTMLFLCETGYQCMVTGSLDPIFHHETTYSGWMRDAELLKLQSKSLSNPEPHGFTVFDYLSRLDSAIEKGDAIARFHAGDKAAHKIVRCILNELKGQRADCLTKQMSQQDRKAPFAVLVAGHSSVGKSMFTKLLYYQFGKLFNLPITSEYRFVRNPFDQYWTNFNSSQWCVQLDDIAFMHPGKQQGCDPSLMEMLQVVNNVPYVPNQADLADKGRTPLRSRFVIATTNTEHLNAKDYFSCPLAVQRRLPYVICIEPKPEYLKDGCMLDSHALPGSIPGTYPDFWIITVKRVKPSKKTNTHMGQVGELETIEIFDSMASFLFFFNDVAREAEGTQDKSMDCDIHMSSAKLCPCGLPEKNCIHHAQELVPVSGVNDETSTESLRRNRSTFARTLGICEHNSLRLSCEICSQQLHAQAGELVVYTATQTDWTTDMIARHTVPPDLPNNEPHLPHWEEGVERYLMGNIIRSIRQMNLLTRFVCMIYWVILTSAKKYPKCNFIYSFILGRWYFYLILVRIMHLPEARNLALWLMGHRAYRRIARNKNVFIFTAGLTVAIVAYKTYSFAARFASGFSEECTPNTSHEMQGRSSEIGSSPESTNDKSENVWYKDDFEVTTFDVPLAIASKATWSLDQMQKFVDNNVVFFKIRVRTETTILEKLTKAVCIGGHVYMCNNHSVISDAFELDVIMQTAKDGVNKNITVLVTSSQVHRVPDKDLVFITLECLPPKRKITNLFVSESYHGKFDGAYFGRNADGSLYKNPLKNIVLERSFEYSDPISGTEFVSDMWSSIAPVPTIKGDCGALMIMATVSGPMLMGIHTLGSGSKAFALSVTSEFLSSLYPSLVSGSTPILQVGQYKQDLGPLHGKSPVRYLQNGTAETFGSFTGFRGKMKSRVCKTFISDIAVEHGYIRDTTQPLMNSWVPWNRALTDMVRPVSHINTDVLNECKKSFRADILAGLTPADLAEIKVYDNFTAINGKAGVAYVDKINRNTSAGFPFRKTKKFFMEAIPEEEGLMNPVKVSEDIVSELDRIIEGYERGETYSPVFTGSLKDEPVSQAKRASGKTRVFCGAPLPWIICVRKYFLSIIRLIQKNRILMESGPGTIAQSTEWDDIYVYLTAWGVDRIVAGDYGKFDKRMPATVIMAAFWILIEIMRAADWTDAEILVAWGIAEDTAYPMVDMMGVLMRFYGSNPSGHPLTVIINGLANSLYVRYCYFVGNPDKECNSFKQNVRLMTYGDDMIMSVHPRCTWIDHTKIRDILADIDIEFTMADKEAPSVSFIHIDDATFLRRCWRFEPELGVRVCPIEHASIDKMLTMCVASKTISAQLQAADVLQTAVREYFWYGKEVFHERLEVFRKIIEQSELEDYVTPFPTWDQLVTEFKANSKIRE